LIGILFRRKLILKSTLATGENISNLSIFQTEIYQAFIFSPLLSWTRHGDRRL